MADLPPSADGGQRVLLHLIRVNSLTLQHSSAMSHSVDDNLLDRYLAGECDSTEHAYVDRMLATNAVWVRRAEQIRVLRSMTQQLPQPWDIERLWSGMQEHRAASSRASSPLPSSASSRRGSSHAASARVASVLPRARGGRWTTLSRIAAAIVIAAGAGALWYASHGVQRERVAHYQLEAGNGRVTSVRLADGSRVTLAAGSVLDVPRVFDKRGRDVTLVGQAYFEIAHDSTRPFRVHTRGTVTRVLGTKFGVRAYPEDSDVTVVVSEGHVAFGADGGESGSTGAAPAVSTDGATHAVTLGRGDRARLEPRGQVSVEHGVALDRELAWMQGRLVFVDAPLSLVAHEVERWYDVHIIIGDSSLASAPVTASFGNEPVDGVLRTLAVSLDVRLVLHGDTAWLGAAP